MTDLWEPIGYFLLAIAVAGFGYQCIVFVRRTLPENYGSNPGFGCFEVMVMPWFLAGCVGAGLVTQSLLWALIPFGIGVFSLGLLAQVLAHFFGGK